MARWRLGRRFPEDELAEYRRVAHDLPLNLIETELAEMTADKGYRAERSDWVIAREEPGPPEAGGAFEKAKEGVAAYAFSDPDIVEGHSDEAPFVGQTRLLEIKVLGLHYLCGTRVREVDEEASAHHTRYAFRYDTLKGHLERGAQRFSVTKDHRSGEVLFSVESRWQRGDLPNTMSQLGFRPTVLFYRNLWLRRAAIRLRALTGAPALEQPSVPRLQTFVGLGALTGIRSTAGPTMVALHSVGRGAAPDATRLERALSSPGAVALLSLAALGEMLADKSPRIPSRMEPPALIGRVVSAGLSAGILATRWRARPLRVPILLAAGSAAASATAATFLRKTLGERLKVPPTLLGLAEDGLVVAADSYLLAQAHRVEPPLLDEGSGGERVAHDIA